MHINPAGYELDVLLQNGKFYEANLKVEHCPSVSGCRAVLTQDVDGGNIFNILENFVMTLKVILEKDNDFNPKVFCVCLKNFFHWM